MVKMNFMLYEFYCNKLFMDEKIKDCHIDSSLWLKLSYSANNNKNNNKNNKNSQQLEIFH